MLTLDSIEQAWDTLLDHFNMLQEKEAALLDSNGSDAVTGNKARVVTFSSDSIVLSTSPPSLAAAADLSLNPRNKMHGTTILTTKTRSKNANQRVSNEKKPSFILLLLELSVVINLIIWPLVWTSRSKGSAVYGLFNRPTFESISVRPSDVTLFIPDMVPESSRTDVILTAAGDASDVLAFTVEEILLDPVAVSTPLPVSLPLPVPAVPVPVFVPMAAALAAEPSSGASIVGEDNTLDKYFSASSSSASSHRDDEDAQHDDDKDKEEVVLRSVDAPPILLSGTGLTKRDVLRFESRGVVEASRIPGIHEVIGLEISKLIIEEYDMDVDIEEGASNDEAAALVVSDNVVGSFSLQNCIASCSDDLKITESVEEDVDHLLACIENEVSKSGMKFGAMQPFHSQSQSQNIFSAKSFWDNYDVHSRVHYKFIKKALKDFNNMVESFLPDVWNMWHSFTAGVEDFFMQALSFITCRDGSEYCYIHGGVNKDSTGFQQCDKRIY